MAADADHDTLQAQLQQIDPYEFQSFIADLWEEEGWDTHVPQNGESSVVAERSGAIDQRLLLQTRRYSGGNTVSKSDIQQAPDADTTVVVTTSAFTEGAKAHAYEHEMKLVDGDDLAEMVQEHGREDLIAEYTDNTNADTDETEPATSPQSRLTDGHLDRVAVVAAVQLGSLALMFQPTLVPAIPESVASVVVLVSWFAGPVAIYTDYRAATLPNGSGGGMLLWLIGSLGLPGVTPALYLVRRLMG